MGQGQGKPEGSREWDAGTVGKTEAEAVLRNCGEGDFLVRVDPLTLQINLSIGQLSSPAVHFVIRRSDLGFTLGADMFPCIDFLVHDIRSRGIQTSTTRLMLHLPVGSRARHLSTDPRTTLGDDMAAWYAGVMKKQDADKLLLAHSPGDYLVRESKDKANTFYLVINDHGSILQYPIYRTEKGEYEFAEKCFQNIAALILTVQKCSLRGSKGKLTLNNPLGDAARMPLSSAPR
jgi:hypothetical protein